MKKKHIFIIATGGTIAGSAAAETATTGYAAGAIGINELLAAVPEVKNIADVSGEELAAIDSKDITQDLQLKLVYRCQELLPSDSVDGKVITHGSATMEETAYLLSLLINSKKTVVFHYGNYIECSLGEFVLNGDKAIINYLLQSGIGSRKSAGFGLPILVAE